MKHFVGTLMSIIMLLVMIVGCAGENTPDEAIEDNPRDEGSERTEVVSDEPKPFEGEVIRVLSHDNVYARSLKALAYDFEEKTGATLELNPVGQSLMEQRIQQDFASGAGSVDVAYLPLIFTSEWASAGWIQPIDDYVARDQTEIDMNDFVASAVDAMRYGNHLYGLPGFAGTALMAYRSDILESHGYTEAPRTWDELLEICEAIDSEKTAAIALRSQSGQGLNMFIFPMFMWGYGGSFFKDFPDDMTPNIDTYENQKALEVYVELVSRYSPEGGGHFSYPDVIEAMQGGSAAIIIDGTSVLAPACDPATNPYSDDIKMALVPEGPWGSSPSFAVHGWAIPTFTKNQELAWAFIKWATSSETQKKMALGEGGEIYLDYTRESVGNDPEVLEYHSSYNIISLRNEALKSTRWDFRPLMNEWTEVGGIFADYVHRTANGEMNPKEALEAVQKEVYDIVRDSYDIQ